MSNDLHNRRRAVYTGLHPYLSRDMLKRALEHWEQHYAQSPRFALQHFVHEICQLADLQQRRSDIYLNLVQAMNMPVESLLDDGMINPDAGPAKTATRDQVKAFEQLLDSFLEQLDQKTDQQLRLDLVARLRHEPVPESLLNSLQRWLLDGEPRDTAPASVETLRAVVNHVYVLLTQYQGPVLADQVLQRATGAMRQAHPELTDALAALL